MKTKFHELESEAKELSAIRIVEQKAKDADWIKTDGDRSDAKAALLMHFSRALNEKMRKVKPGQVIQTTFRIDILKNGKVIRETDCRASFKSINWSKKIKRRAHGKCEKCGEKSEILQAHHIHSWAEYPSLRFDSNNGIALCRECHSKQHPDQTNLILSNNPAWLPKKRDEKQS